MEARPKVIKTIRQLWVVPAMVTACFLLVFYLLPPASAQVGPQSTNSLRTPLSPRIENPPGVQRFSRPAAAVTPEPKDPPQAVELRATLAISTSDEQPQPQSDVLAAQNREALLLEAARNAFERQLSSGS